MSMARDSLAVLLSMGLGWASLAADAPDAEVNPATGEIESVDTELNGVDFDLRHTVDPGQGAPGETVLLTISPDNDLRPRMTITPGGQAWVVWWRDASTNAVLCRKRAGNGSWQPERTVSLPAQNSHHPEIAFHGTHPWIAYEFDGSGGTGIAAVGIDDTPDPFGRTTLAVSQFAGDPDVRIHAESGHLWITWIQDGSFVGWSELDPGSQTWLPAGLESYVTDGSVAGARSRIRTQVLTP